MAPMNADLAPQPLHFSVIYVSIIHCNEGFCCSPASQGHQKVPAAQVQRVFIQHNTKKKKNPSVLIVILNVSAILL